MHRAQPPTLAHQRNTHGTSNSRPLLSSFTSCLFFPLLFFSPSSPCGGTKDRRESQEAARFNLFIPRSLLISSLISLPPSSLSLALSPFFFLFITALSISAALAAARRERICAHFSIPAPRLRALLPKRGIFPGRATNETAVSTRAREFPSSGEVRRPEEKMMRGVHSVRHATRAHNSSAHGHSLSLLSLPAIQPTYPVHCASCTY